MSIQRTVLRAGRTVATGAVLGVLSGCRFYTEAECRDDIALLESEVVEIADADARAVGQAALDQARIAADLHSVEQCHTQIAFVRRVLREQ